MDVEKLIDYCLSKENTYQDFPFGPEPLAIKVDSEMFVLISTKSGKPAISLKCDPFVAQTLREQYPAIEAGFHQSKQHWNTVTIDGSVPDEELYWMIDHSYELVQKKSS